MKACEGGQNIKGFIFILVM